MLIISNSKEINTILTIICRIKHNITSTLYQLLRIHSYNYKNASNLIDTNTHIFIFVTPCIISLHERTHKTQKLRVGQYSQDPGRHFLKSIDKKRNKFRSRTAQVSNCKRIQTKQVIKRKHPSVEWG